MARGNDINQRIVLTGADEVRRHLEEIAAAGQRAGSQTRSALLAATSGAQGFTQGTRAAAGSSGQLRFALQNLSFQVNDIATSWASGADPMRVFAQQGGQIFQVFQQGGGLSTVLGGAATAIRGMITPLTAAAAAAVALGAGLALVISRATSMEQSTREFDVVLKGLGKTSRATGKELTTAAQNLKDVGLSFSEGQKAIKDAIQQGVDPRQVTKVIRTAQNLNTILGEGSAEKFIAAVAKGGEPLREFGERLGIIPKNAADTSKALDAAAAATARSTRAIDDAIISRNRSIADEIRQRDLAILDLTRKRGTAEEEIQLASNRRIEEINRAHVVAVNDLIAQRNAANAKALAEFNQATLEAAQKAADAGQSLIDQISGRAEGARRAALSPLGLAIDDLRIAWENLSNTVANSWFIQSFVTKLTGIIDVVRLLIAELGKIDTSTILGLASAATGGIGLGSLIAGKFASGTGSTPPGTILVGERGPELITQPGGLGVWSNPQTKQILAAFKAMRFQMPRSRSFAAGNMAGASLSGGARTPIVLNIGGETFGLESDAATAQRVMRFARRSGMLSAGRKPSTA